ncbi:hypothetical protein RIF29_11698 [Crotalaria pallida]|uniref:Uncharacterized protein n=1 Tax=Crotalaria pallida TaxID=3830 RepID=A0AAN9P126_CROPI
MMIHAFIDHLLGFFLNRMYQDQSDLTSSHESNNYNSFRFSQIPYPCPNHHRQCTILKLLLRPTEVCNPSAE